MKDLNGDGVTNNQDYATIGNPNPLHYGGFTNNFTYKGFDLSVFMQWVYGNQILNGNKALFDGGTTADARNQDQNMFAEYADYWTPNNDGAQYPRPLAQATNVRTISSRLIGYDDVQTTGPRTRPEIIAECQRFRACLRKDNFLNPINSRIVCKSLGDGNELSSNLTDLAKNLVKSILLKFFIIITQLLFLGQSDYQTRSTCTRR
jgi:hypothetical protein